jgi:hypothetical protein
MQSLKSLVPATDVGEDGRLSPAVDQPYTSSHRLSEDGRLSSAVEEPYRAVADVLGELDHIIDGITTRHSHTLPHTHTTPQRLYPLNWSLCRTFMLRV